MNKISSLILNQQGYRRSPNYYKSPTFSRSNHGKTNAPQSSASNYKPNSLTHVENISSDEAQLVNGDNEISGTYSRSHRSKKEKRQSRRKRPAESEKERCLQHGKRRCIEPDCYPIETVPRKKRSRHKHDDRKTNRGKYSSESEDELLRNRDEIKMALNIIEPAGRSLNPSTSTLSHKLSVIKNQVALDDGKKSTSNKSRKRKSSRSPERRKYIRPRSRSRENSSYERTRSERDRNVGSRKSSNSKKSKGLLNADYESMSLEEQELRLIALKSAVLKKHEARQRRLLISKLKENVCSPTPYSPTDSVTMVADETGDRSNDCIESDNNNMDISPCSSPNQYQAVDMDLATSNENSNSPVFSYEKPQQFPPYQPYIDWGAVHIPVPINPTNPNNATFIGIGSAAATLNRPFSMQASSSFAPIYDNVQNGTLFLQNGTPTSTIPPFQPSFKENTDANTNVDNEDELRAQLIEQLRSTNASTSNGMSESTKNVPKEINNDDSLEEDCLRSLLLSAKGKKSTIPKESTTDSNTSKSLPKIDKLPSKQDKCDDMPKLALNLREALKRLKSAQQTKTATATATEASKSTTIAAIDPSKSTSIQFGSMQIGPKNDKLIEDCDQNEIQKTAVNNQLDKNINDPCKIVETPTIVPSKPIQNTTAIQNDDDKVTNTPSDIVEETVKLIAPQTNKNDAKNVIAATVATSAKASIPTKVATPAKVAQPIKATAAKPMTKQNIITKPKPKVPVKPKPVEKSLSLTPLGPATTTATTTATTANTITNLNKIDSIRKSTSSPIVTNWTAKPVKKLIISLQDDSSTDNDDMDNDDKSTDKTTNLDSNAAFEKLVDQYLQKARDNNTTKPETKQPKVNAQESQQNPSKTIEKTVPKQKTQVSRSFFL